MCLAEENSLLNLHMPKKLFFVLFAFISCVTYAQTHTIKGMGNLPNGVIIHLWKTTGRTLDLVDSTKVSNNAYEFKGTYSEGLYAVGVNPSTMVIFAMDNNEPTTVLKLTSMKWDTGTTCAEGENNKIWFEYVPKEAEFNKNKRELTVKWKRDGDTSAQHKLQALERDFINYQNSLIAKKKCFATQVIQWKQEPYSDKVHYWDNINFADTRILHTTVLNDRIQSFMRSFSKGTESGFIDCIALVADKAHANQDVYEYALNEMLTGFYESGMENITVYLMDNYINDNSCGDENFSNVIKRNAESIGRLAIGSTPLNITGNDQNDAAFDLKKTCSKNSYTVLMFWSSWCTHCKQESPKITALYKNYSAKKVAFVGYSVDTDVNAWRAALTEREFTFTNVCGLKGWESKAAKDYRVTKTPAFYVLDKNMKIVAKPRTPEELETFLKLGSK